MHTKYLKRIIAFVILLSMLFTTVAMAIPYGQAKKLIRNGYSWENVEKYVQGKGIMKGFPDGKFYENLNVKRADAIIMIDRAFKLSALVDLINRDYKDIFDDVDESEYYFDAVYIAKLIGITKGRGNNNFHPKQSVTIEEVILLIERAMEKSKYFEFDDDIDLRENYKDMVEKNKDLKDFATRGEIAAMLYYVLTGSKYNDEPDSKYDLKEISRTIEEDEILTFDDNYGKKDSIIESIEDLVDALEYVEFTKPLNKNNNFLYYEYTGKGSDSFVINDRDYYVNPIGSQKALSEVTIVPKTSGVLEIEYIAYDDEGDSYKGLIKITVEDKYDDLDDIAFTGHENTPIKFIISKFKEVFKKEFEYTSDDEISLELPDKKFGTLYFDENNDGKLGNTEKIEAKNSFKLKQMARIYFYPAADFVDEKDPAVIEYTVEDKDDNFYEGKINIKVSALLDKLTIDEDDDFGEEVKNHLDEFDDYVFETIKFEKLDEDDDFDLNFENKTSSLFEIEFYITHLEDVVFNPGSDFDGATLKYTVTTDDGLEFTGLVTVEVDD
jgi:hypothetical protein